MAVTGRTYIPVVDGDLCQQCGVCVRHCPAEFMQELRTDGDTVRGYVYATTDLTTRMELPPCVGACPLGQKVRDYVQLLASGKVKEALVVIRQDNPLPGICAYVCHHPCEQACVRGSWDDPVSIRELKRYAVQYEVEHVEEVIQMLQNRKQPTKQRRVVIIGAGPAGLSCAFELTMQGYEVTVMDKLDQPGGMLVGGIPPFRLPRFVIKHDVDVIRSLGVKFQGSVCLGQEITLRNISKNGADAVVLATGAWEDLALNVTGDDAEGCLMCIDFLNKINTGKDVKVSGKVIVVGGGNAAIDTARSALRLGPEKVVVVYRRSQEEMPANPEEVEDALAEGVVIRYLEAPTQILVENGHVQGVELIQMELGDVDDTGRRRPVPIKGSAFFEKADVVIPAIGQRPDLSFLEATSVTERGTLYCDVGGAVLGYDNVFAAGDAVSGPSTVVESMASGKVVARTVMNYLEET